MSTIERTPVLRGAVRGCLRYVRSNAMLQEHVIPRLLGEGSPWLSTISDGRHRLGRTKDELAEMARGTDPIIVGPWLSEVGFELLYWIPFLTWCVRTFGLSSERLVVVSRGGTELWYRRLGARYVDILDHFGPEEFRARNLTRVQETGGQKHRAIGDFDLEIVARVKASLGLGESVRWLHPSFMYNLFLYFWRRRQPLSFVKSHVVYEPFAPVANEETAGWLPAEYAAAKFYFSACLPDLPENRRFIATILGRLSRKLPVVVLSSGVRLDDHTDWVSEGVDAGNIITVEKRMTPARNLAIQTAIVSRAKMFAGTYGGFSYLAPFYGVRSATFFSDDQGFLPVHLEVAREAFRAPGFGPFTALGVDDVDHLVYLVT